MVHADRPIIELDDLARVNVRTRLRVDADGELTEWPPWLLAVWIVLLALTALEAFNELGWIGRPSSFFEDGIHDAVLVGATVLIFVRAAFEPVARRAWLCFGGALAAWSAGTILWSVIYGGDARPPYPSFADALWLLWYPLMAAGMVYLIQVRFRRFEVHRWMDGIAVMLIVLVAGFGLVVQPLAEHSTQSTFATVVDFELSGPRCPARRAAPRRLRAVWGGDPTRCGSSSAWESPRARVPMPPSPSSSPAVSSESGNYDFVWTLGALFIAYAAWVRSPTVHDDDRQVTGMRAIALALIAQAIAIAIQILAIFKHLGRASAS